MNNKHYFVSLLLNLNGNEKFSKYIVAAPTETLAQSYAFYSESHQQDYLEWHEGAVLEICSEYVYNVHECKLIPDNKLETLKGYLGIYFIDHEDLQNSSNYLDIVSEEDYKISFLSILQSEGSSLVNKSDAELNVIITDGFNDKKAAISLIN